MNIYEFIYKCDIDLDCFRGDNVVAVATMNYDPYAAQAAEMFRTGKPFSKDDIL
jgi:hypothetical protein